MKGKINMKKSNEIEVKSKKTVNKKVLAKYITIMLCTVAIMSISVPVCFAAAPSTADSAFAAVVGEFVSWCGKIGGVVAFVGGIMFALAVKNNDAEQKQSGLLTLVAGCLVMGVCGLSSTFGVVSDGGSGNTTTPETPSSPGVEVIFDLDSDEI